MLRRRSGHALLPLVLVLLSLPERSGDATADPISDARRTWTAGEYGTFVALRLVLATRPDHPAS